MIGDLRLEFLRRIMTALIKISKGNTYLEKLESSYKTNMIVFFFVLLALVGLLVKYIELDYYAKDAENAYLDLVQTVNESSNLLKSMRVAYDDKTELIEGLKTNNAQLKSDIKVLTARVQELEDEKRTPPDNKSKK